MQNNIYVDLHVLQTVPPSNMNRDDTGSPKTAQYGGVTRARVSSQSWKKAMRDYFKEHEDKETLGIRTKKIVQSLAKVIMEKEPSMDEKSALNLAEAIFNKAKISTKDQEAKALFFLGGKQREKLAAYGLEHADDLQTKELQSILNANQSIDVALFGRMAAEAPELNVDASSQVAHAISTHGITPEFDFFTAVDDLTSDDQAGAGMLGTVEYNSSTLYRYANVAVHELCFQLGDNKEAVMEALKLFVKGFVLSLPTGKINTFANQTLPNALIVSIRSDRPVNLVSAFENPVKSRDGDGYVAESVFRLKAEFEKINRFAEPPIATFTVGDVEGLGEDKESLNELLEKFGETIDQLL
ncbi:type I-E CRISPR-associated protein Cas7/Cse4/CasC [Aminipila butyrica]|uniref:Type I-E CRISPR-associated protein Cas7/Cse4/CasC n=1 Tax=Aminipila butyrica TaxID=433296 RepID=A0A858BTK7_9FIRM|nr:type I-E CRISPR-associated protein Cas7/Cse4/CasC [Aminipila butyrica]QIB68682.1 type I-E CRISPR-associated protein Cas7/Cse4/CasC [Aminipila butyrica]